MIIQKMKLETVKMICVEKIHETEIEDIDPASEYEKGVDQDANST